MTAPSAGALSVRAVTPGQWLVPLRQALARVSPSTSLERLTVLAAQPESLLWLSAEYSSAASGAEPALEGVPVPSAPDRVVAVQARSSGRASPSARDPTLPYLGTQDGERRPRKGALLDVRA